MKKRERVALLTAVLMITSIPVPSYGAWVQKGNKWLYENNQFYEKGIWKMIPDDTGNAVGRAWYYFDNAGNMVTGWQLIDGKWYFFSTQSDGTQGQMCIGWQWIDGRCYYLADQPAGNYPVGAMYLGDITPDGYSVDSSGAWIDGGVVQYVPGKGIQTVIHQKTVSTSKFSGGGSGGGGGGSGGHGSSKPGKENRPDSGSGNPATRESDQITGERDQATEESDQAIGERDPVAGESDPDTGTELPESGEPSGELPDPVAAQYKYTIRYLDIADKTILRVQAGIGEEKGIIPITYPDLPGYELCSGQKENFVLLNDDMAINICYEKVNPASPSEARKVDWNLCFVEEGNRSNEIFKTQRGQTAERTDLAVDFPETILGTDRYYYHSLIPSPWRTLVNGAGTQKYYVEYRKGEQAPEEADPDQEAKNRLNEWLEIARKADIPLTGTETTDAQIITRKIQESNERLLNLVSMVDSTDRQEVYLIAAGYIPSAAIIGQTFQDVKNVSELVRDEFTIAGEAYTILRVGFEKTFSESTGNYDYEVIDRVEPTCTENGHETVRGRKSGKEETVILPAKGHIDKDGDGICDVCYKPADEVPEAVHCRIGDVQARTIGNRIYLFRCIDDDYEDAMDNSQKRALFLCDSVIRSDVPEKAGHAVDGAVKKLNFGDNNNYKYSKIRNWLLDNADSDFVHETYIGITKSYIGTTWKGSYEQFGEGSLMGAKDIFQLLQDRIFILSVDEAIKYRDYLWKFGGSETGNPESQISAYSKGYYLRTPQDGGINDFQYGNGIYTVSLVNGNIQPVDIKETSIGIRPVMAVPQG